MSPSSAAVAPTTALAEMKLSSDCLKTDYSVKPRAPMGAAAAAAVAAVCEGAMGDDGDDGKEQPDFIETKCRWIGGCDREFDTQDQLVKVSIDEGAIGGRLSSPVLLPCCTAATPLSSSQVGVVLF